MRTKHEENGEEKRFRGNLYKIITPVLIAAFGSVIVMVGSNLISELRATHDAVLILQAKMPEMVRKADFDLAIQGIQASQAAIAIRQTTIEARVTTADARQAANELEIFKLKEHK